MPEPTLIAIRDTADGPVKLYSDGTTELTRVDGQGETPLKGARAEAVQRVIAAERLKRFTWHRGDIVFEPDSGMPPDSPDSHVSRSSAFVAPSDVPPDSTATGDLVAEPGDLTAVTVTGNPDAGSRFVSQPGELIRSDPEPGPDDRFLGQPGEMLKADSVRNASPDDRFVAGYDDLEKAKLVAPTPGPLDRFAWMPGSVVLLPDETPAPLPPSTADRFVSITGTLVPATPTGSSSSSLLDGGGLTPIATPTPPALEPGADLTWEPGDLERVPTPPEPEPAPVTAAARRPKWYPPVR